MSFVLAVLLNLPRVQFLRTLKNSCTNHGEAFCSTWQNDFERIELNGVPAAAEGEHIEESTYLKLELRNILSMSKILKTSSAYLLCEKVSEAFCSSSWLGITKEQPLCWR